MKTLFKFIIFFVFLPVLVEQVSCAPIKIMILNNNHPEVKKSLENKSSQLNKFFDFIFSKDLADSTEGALKIASKKGIHLIFLADQFFNNQENQKLAKILSLSPFVLIYESNSPEPLLLKNKLSQLTFKIHEKEIKNKHYDYSLASGEFSSLEVLAKYCDSSLFKSANHLKACLTPHF